MQYDYYHTINQFYIVYFIFPIKVVAKTTLKTENESVTAVTNTTANLQQKETTNVTNLNALIKLKNIAANSNLKVTNNHLKAKTILTNNLKQQGNLLNEKVFKQVNVGKVSDKKIELKAGIIDIDKDDGDNILLVAEYVNDIYRYLNQLEDQQSLREDFLSDQLEVTSRMRGILIDWISEVQVQFHLLDETFQLAVGLIDRYLQIVKTTKRKQLQLVGVTALFIAVKYEELFPPAICDFVYITDEAYTSKDIFDMEREMFQMLDFSLSRPLPIHFLRRYSKAALTTENQYIMTKYFVELALMDYSTAHYKPSKASAVECD